uniref:gamma-glutamylcyclotransferase n=1 Tax=Neobodo designis TaxID=312471 RepID=A0A7S1R3E4_NEODS|mmetsp:Transcript_735/g.2549  ORF Transcript_735/g.2549 Transcript_735/m.2549 type:complete len:206 (+) Transcript_735:40-657(+)
MPELNMSSDPLACSIRAADDGVLEDAPIDAQGTALYFAYGSNMSETQLADRVGQPKSVWTGALQSYRLRFNKLARDDTSAFANVEYVPGDENAVTLGKVYALSARQLSEMDMYEGAPTHYSRRVLLVRVFDGPKDGPIVAASLNFNNVRNRGTLRKCVVYIANREHTSAEDCPPSRRYLRKLLSCGPAVPQWYASWLAQRDTKEV